MRISIEGELSAGQAKQHVSHALEVPPNAQELDIAFTFWPDAVNGIKNMITLTLLDPNSFRGAGHRGGGVHEVHIDSANATPGYLPGDLTVGTWTLILDVHMVADSRPVRWRADISIGISPAPRGARDRRKPTATQMVPPRHCDRDEPGWYRGDIHSHTDHSDGQWGTDGLVNAAVELGLDFVALTDHNTISGLDRFLTASDRSITAIPGIELTTFHGHLLILGSTHWIDWRLEGGRTMDQIVSQANDDGLFTVIAHPCAPGDPICTGCDWDYADVQPGNVQAVEIWNGRWDGEARNEEALRLWYAWLCRGHRIAATAGSDAHLPAEYIGNPGVTCALSPSGNASDIMAAISAGRSYLTSGPRLVLTSSSGGGEVVTVGGSCRRGNDCLVRAEWRGAPPGAVVHLVGGGRVMEERDAAARGEFSFRPDADTIAWVVAELRESSGGLVAITNPIWL